MPAGAGARAAECHEPALKINSSDMRGVLFRTRNCLLSRGTTKAVVRNRRGEVATQRRTLSEPRGPAFRRYYVYWGFKRCDGCERAHEYFTQKRFDNSSTEIRVQNLEPYF